MYYQCSSLLVRLVERHVDDLMSKRSWISSFFPFFLFLSFSFLLFLLFFLFLFLFFFIFFFFFLFFFIFFFFFFFLFFFLSFFLSSFIFFYFFFLSSEIQVVFVFINVSALHSLFLVAWAATRNRFTASNSCMLYLQEMERKPKLRTYRTI